MPDASQLFGQARGETVWLLASGSSLTYVSRAFFADKITVAVSEAAFDFPTTYACFNHHDRVAEALDAGLIVVAPHAHCGVQAWGSLLPAQHDRLYVFDHGENQMTRPLDVSDLDGESNRLLMTASTVVTALHFAFRLGAAAIMLCGMDGGLLDGQMNYPDYLRRNGGESTRLPHIRLTTHLIVALVDEIRRRGVAVHSLNPFMNFTLEDHRFESLTEDLLSVRSMHVREDT